MKLLVTKTLLVKALEYVSLSNYKAGDDEEDKAIMISCDNYVLDRKSTRLNSSHWS